VRVGGILHLAQELNKTQYSDSCYVKQNLVAVSRKVQTKINAFEMKALRKLLRTRGVQKVLQLDHKEEWKCY